MKRILFTTLSLAICVVTMAATPTNEDLKIKIWDNTTAPHSSGLSGEITEEVLNRLGNVNEAELLVFKANEQKNSGQAVVICPGGGYRILSIDIEGTMVAEWLAESGITAAVLKYRIPNGNYEVPFEDAVEALRIMRKRSSELGFDADKVGMMGFSAGGHLTASVATLAPVEERPNFSVLFYTLISVEALNRENTLKLLFGDSCNERTYELSELHEFVDESTPPTIMINTNDDTIVPADNSALYYCELRRRNIYASLYVFPLGGHGWSMTPRVKSELWQPLLLDWLENLEYNNE